MRFRWFAQPELKRQVLGAPSYALGRAAGFVFDAAANAAPYVCSRGWCFLVGGFEEFEFRFRRPRWRRRPGSIPRSPLVDSPHPLC